MNDTDNLSLDERISRALQRFAGSRWYANLSDTMGKKTIVKGGTVVRGDLKKTVKHIFTLEQASDIFPLTYADPRFQRPDYWKQAEWDSLTLTILQNDTIPEHYLEDIYKSLELDQEYGHLSVEQKETLLYYLEVLEKQLSNIDSNNRFTYYSGVRTERITMFPDGITFTAANEQEYKVPEGGWTLSTMPPELKKLWLNFKISATLLEGNNEKESAQTFKNYNKMGGPTFAEFRNCEWSKICKAVRELVNGPDIGRLSETPSLGLLGEWKAWRDQPAKIRAKLPSPPMHFMSNDGRGAILERRALDEMFAYCFYMYCHRDGDIPTVDNGGSLKSNVRLTHFYTEEDATYFKDWPRFERFLSTHFLPWWNNFTVSWGKKKEEKRKDPTNSELFDCIHVLFEILDDRKEIMSKEKFLVVCRDMFSELCDKYPELTQDEIESWQDATLAQREDLRTPKCHEWKAGSSGIYSSRATYNFRKKVIKEYYQENKDRWFNENLEVDHFIPRGLGGEDDISNFFLVTHEDHRGRMHKDWFDHWEDRYGEKGKLEFIKHFYDNDLHYLLESKEETKVDAVKKNESCVLSAK
jgi:5-methylcytosine-specific restriction endonuclease McrA